MKKLDLGLTHQSIFSYKETYKSLLNRITERGYAATSLTGTYEGMFPRDSSIQALVHMQYGDLESAKKILNYLLTYNQGIGFDYMGHIIDCYQDEYYGNDYLLEHTDDIELVSKDTQENPVGDLSELLRIGGDTYATQEIPTFNSETITAVKIKVRKTETATGNLVGTLYKKDGTDLQYVDECLVNINLLEKEDEVTFRFGLPLEMIKEKESNYVFKLSAPDTVVESVIWLGSKAMNRYETNLYQKESNSSVSGEASYTAYKSDIKGFSDKIQVDGHYMVIYSWAKFANAVRNIQEYKDWISKSYALVAKLANYYVEDNNLINKDYNLMYNPCIEHSRNNQYHMGYDLITNVFVSQSLYEMSLIAKGFGDTLNSEKWNRIDQQIVKGINEKLTSLLDGRKIYSEMFGKMIDETCEDYYIKGFSWINLAPLAADWHAMDPVIMKNTYEVYQKFGSADYTGFIILDACVFLNKEETALDPFVGGTGRSESVIGKGWSWELMYNKSIKDIEKVDYLMGFSLVHQPDNKIYTESWWQKKPGKITYSDPGNQEHASWQHYAMSVVYPTLTKQYGIHLKEYNKLIDKVNRLSSNDYTSESWNEVQNIIENSKLVLNEEDLLQAEVDNIVTKFSASIHMLMKQIKS
jgi:hypothetical protein